MESGVMPETYRVEDDEVSVVVFRDEIDEYAINRRIADEVNGSWDAGKNLAQVSAVVWRDALLVFFRYEVRPESP